MPQECTERLRFSRKVIEALRAVYALRDELKAPDTAIELTLARDELTNATRAFDKHLAEHGCMSSKGYD
jgi:hypothetical protein